MNAFVEYFKSIQEHNGDIGYIHSCPELMECIRQVGFLPLLESGIQGMGTHIVTEDFVYPVDKHGREYGFGWSLLTTPEQLMGREACMPGRTPEESYQRMVEHLTGLLPDATEKQIKKILK